MSAKGCWGAKLEGTLFFLSEYLYFLSFHNFDTYTGLRAKQVEKRETVSFRPREDHVKSREAWSRTGQCDPVV